MMLSLLLRRVTSGPKKNPSGAAPEGRKPDSVQPSRGARVTTTATEITTDAPAAERREASIVEIPWANIAPQAAKDAAARQESIPVIS